MAGEVLARVGHVEEAREALADWDANYAPSEPWEPLRRRAAGALVSWRVGQVQTAVAELQQVQAGFEQEEMALEAVWTQIDLGRALLEVDLEALRRPCAPRPRPHPRSVRPPSSSSQRRSCARSASEPGGAPKPPQPAQTRCRSSAPASRKSRFSSRKEPATQRSPSACTCHGRQSSTTYPTRSPARSPKPHRAGRPTCAYVAHTRTKVDRFAREAADLLVRLVQRQPRKYCD